MWLGPTSGDNERRFKRETVMGLGPKGIERIGPKGGSA